MINIVQSCLRQGDKVKKLFDRKAKCRIYNRREYRSKTSGGKSAYSRKLCGMFYVKQKGGTGDIRGKNRRSSCLFGRVALFCTADFLIRKFDFAGSKPDLYNRRINAV